MIRRLIIDKIGHITDTEFHCAMECTTTDVRVNRIRYGKTSDINYISYVAVRVIELFRKV